jgi:hypothetical protein
MRTDLVFPCKCLRSKDMYYGAPGAEPEQDGGGAFWCLKTHEAFGPDGQPASREECAQTRECYGR